MNPNLTTQFSLRKPASTHRKPVPCSQENCRYYREGWQMRIMVGTPLGEKQSALVQQSGRRFVGYQESASTLLLTFAPGQQCFGSHTAPVDKPALYVVRQGQNVKQHTSPENWVDDFSTHLDKLREQ